MFMKRLKAALASDPWVVLDTETTGIGPGAEAVQIGVLSSDGDVLMDTLVQPLRPIPPDAVAIHGITNAMVADAPKISDVCEELRALLTDRHCVVYNAEYDLGILKSSTNMRGLLIDWSRTPLSWLCAMRTYAEFKGEPGRRPGDFRWHKLGVACQHQGIPVLDAHSAIADCRMTLQLVRKLLASG